MFLFLNTHFLNFPWWDRQSEIHEVIWYNRNLTIIAIPVRFFRTAAALLLLLWITSLIPVPTRPPWSTHSCSHTARPIVLLPPLMLGFVSNRWTRRVLWMNRQTWWTRQDTCLDWCLRRLSSSRFVVRLIHRLLSRFIRIHRLRLILCCYLWVTSFIIETKKQLFFSDF